MNARIDANQMWTQLRTLDTREPGNWPRWVHVVTAVLLALILLGGGTYMIVEPDYDELQIQKKQEQDLRAEFERKQKKVAALDAYRQQLDEMQHSFGDMLKQLPSRTEVANLLNDISQTRIASSLDEELFEPLPEAPKDFYAEIPNRIVVTGTYNQMGSFVSGVAALPRIVVIDEVQIQPVGGSAPKDELRLTALAKTYRYLDDSEQRGPAPAKRPK